MKKDKMIARKIMEALDYRRENPAKYNGDIVDRLCYVSGWISKEYPEVSLALYQIVRDDDTEDM